MTSVSARRAGGCSFPTRPFLCPTATAEGRSLKVVGRSACAYVTPVAQGVRPTTRSAAKGMFLPTGTSRSSTGKRKPVTQEL